MKMLISANLALLAAMCASNLAAQDQQQEVSSKVAEEVSEAATRVGVKSDPALTKAFIDAASNQKAAFEVVYKSVPEKQRVYRLGRYLAAKELTKTDATPTARFIQADFNWRYLAHDINYTTARLEASEDARLLNIYFAKGDYDFSHAGVKIHPGMTFVMPAGHLTATFELGGRRTLWTGNSAGGVMKIVAASTYRGCEIFVHSKPSGAAVYFNGNKWYERTTTSSVRDAGTWEVILKLQGHKEWREQRQLMPGDSWTIDATLLKRER